MSRFTCFSRGKIWFDDLGPCKRFDILQLCIWISSLKLHPAAFAFAFSPFCKVLLKVLPNHTKEIQGIGQYWQVLQNTGWEIQGKVQLPLNDLLRSCHSAAQFLIVSLGSFHINKSPFSFIGQSLSFYICILINGILEIVCGGLSTQGLKNPHCSFRVFCFCLCSC